MKAKISIAALLVLLFALPSSLAAKGNPAAGQQKAQVCEACHGPTGKSIDPTYPNLGGQYYSYLVQALADYRSGQRTNAVMAGFASQLSNQDIEDLAAWYSSQDGLKDIQVK